MNALITASAVAVLSGGLLLNSLEGSQDMAQSYAQLTPEEERVIVSGGTESPFVGEYVNTFEQGTYACRRCGAQLFESNAKFESHCGWPSFDAAIPGAVETRPDDDGIRTEIVCAACGAHLGHVFEGEGYTPTDTRHCVNSLSLRFRPSTPPTERAVFAGGCFWGVESSLGSLGGVLSTTVGYTGGTTASPTYEDVCTGTTGHAEAVEVVFDPSVISYEELVRTFFEIHDPTTQDRQGVDVGSQYRSAVFTTSDAQRETVERLLAELADNGFEAVTQVVPAAEFWPAEAYHQDYYATRGITAFCSLRVPRFGE